VLLGSLLVLLVLLGALLVLLGALLVLLGLAERVWREPLVQRKSAGVQRDALWMGWGLEMLLFTIIRLLNT